MQLQFQHMITLLERRGYIERAIRAGNKFTLKPAKLIPKALAFLWSSRMMNRIILRSRELEGTGES